MPLPPLPPNNTDRIWFRYQTGVAASSQVHEVMWRFDASAVTSDDCANAFLGLLNAIGAGNLRTGWRVTSARVSPKLSVFSTPVLLPAGLLAFVGTKTDAAYNERWEAVEDTYQGRSLISGRRVSFSLYRAVGEASPSFRIGLPSAQQTALSTASGSQCLEAIDNTNPSWYTYINQNYNSYWERELRN